MSSNNEKEKVASSRDLEATHMLDGVFYNHLKQKIAPVFGDPNQIRLLQHYNNLKEELKQGMEIEIFVDEIEDGDSEEYTEVSYVAFDCFCGRLMNQTVWHNPPLTIQRKRTLQCECTAVFELRALNRNEVTGRQFIDNLFVKLISHEK
jgi:hypothetical protein